MARGKTRIARLRRRLEGIGFGLMVIGGLAALILLLPLIVPVVAISEALDERRLARFKCLACGQPIGREEIRRARREAVVEGWPRAGPLDQIRRRVIVIWEVICPHCGHRYTYRPSQPRASLVPGGTSGQAA